MKKIYSLFIFSIITITAFGQQLVEEGKMWSYVQYDFWSPDINTFIYKIEGDTFIDGETYKQVFVSSDSLATPFVPFVDVPFVRETDDGKVFVRNSFFSNDDYLIYDFSLTVGDTMFYPFSTLSPITAVVTAVDTITLLNGDQRKRLTFDSHMYGPQHMWIEGVGSTDYFVSPNVIDWGEGLLCLHDTGSLVFQNGDDGCFVLITNTEEVLQDNFNFSFFPNPSNGAVQFNYAAPHSVTDLSLVITDLSGRTLHHIALTEPEDTLDLDFSDLPNGLYFCRLTAHGHLLKTERLVIGR